MLKKIKDGKAAGMDEISGDVWGGRVWRNGYASFVIGYKERKSSQTFGRKGL